MLNFKPITVADKEVITSFTLASAYSNCDFAFANMCSWRFLYDSEFAVADGFLFLRFYVTEKGRRHLAYMFPVGTRNDALAAAITTIEKDAAEHGFPLLMLGVTPESKEVLNTLFPNSFAYIQERNYYDYIYRREDLVNLTGKKFQPKRNHINKFRKLYDYQYINITADITPECMKLEQQWFADNEQENDREALLNERQSMCFALSNFDGLGLMGGAIKVDGKIVAFTYGSPINADTFGIHVEKADINYEGVFSLINQEFASRIPEQYVYLNREEDLGIAGLRQSKLSYNPVIILEKNAAVKRR
jgi:hypothetical protein